MTSANQMKADLRRMFDDGWSLEYALASVVSKQHPYRVAWFRSLWARWEDEAALALVQAVMAGCST